MADESAMDRTTYQPSRPLFLVSIVLAVFTGCLAGVFLIFFAVTIFRADFEDTAWVGFDAVAFAAFAAVMWRQSRIHVVVQDNGLQVVNYLSTFHVPWDSIDRFDSSFGYWGIPVRMKDGRTLWLNAIQKSNIAVWLKGRTRADEIANDLNERLQGVGAAPSPSC